MNISEIKQKREKLFEKKQKIDRKIKNLQATCTHPEEVLTFKYGSNTGNYDPSADLYWTDYTCGVCGKKWTCKY